MFGKPIPQKTKAKQLPVVQKKQKEKWINPLKDRARVLTFVVPDKAERLAAIGSFAGQKWCNKKSLQAIIQDFDPIKTPEPGDNLYHYEEEGQDYPLFKTIYRNHIDLESQVIYIIPFYCNLQKQTIKKIKTSASNFFLGVKVKTFEIVQKVDLNKFDPMQSMWGQTYYDAAKINKYFTRVLPKNTFSIAIITSLLLYNGDRNQTQLQQKWIFGLGSIKDRTSITSFQEVLKKGYARKKQQGVQNQQFNVTMLKRIVNHQVCHTFAMKHCIYFTCLMNGSNGYHQASSKDQHLCPVCLRKLQSQINFDFAQRFQALADQKSIYLAGKIRTALGQKK